MLNKQLPVHCSGSVEENEEEEKEERGEQGQAHEQAR